MKRIVYAILVAAAPLMGQGCNTSLLSQGLPCVNTLPTREFGQPNLLTPLNSNSPNLVIGQELFNPSGIAFDTSVTPPRVYVVDTGNNRVLGWSNANNVSQGTFADMVLGQPAAVTGGLDFTATAPWVPGSADNLGLDAPTGVAVDAAGNVYVADSGNNRILRFPTPYKQQPGNFVSDLVIGQKSASSGNSQNMGQSIPSASSLYLTVGSSSQAIVPAGLAIDSAGNLWVADPGNNRVLMFPASNLSANTQLPQATLVLGQTGFTSNQVSNGSQTNASILANPNSVAVDAQGNVYVTDGYARALVFAGPTSTGQPAKTILGVPPTPTQGQPPTYPSQSTLGAIGTGGQLTTAVGIFVANTGSGVSVFVCDSPQNRVVVYNSLTVPGNANSPQQSIVIGQNGFTLGQTNQGFASPTNQTFAFPVAGAIRPDNNEMWIVDQGNHRVVAFPTQVQGATASRVLGQKDFIYNGANLLEGRELWLSTAFCPQSIPQCGGSIAVDPNGCTASSCSSNPYLYIADTLNNRVLGFKNALKVGTDIHSVLNQTADLVIGQPDLLHNIINYNSNNPNGSSPTSPAATGLFHPIAVTVDQNGNLWVADSGNSRVVRFPAPFAQAPNAVQTANVVLGQASLTSLVPGVSQFNMEEPYGLALFPDTGNLAVSDPAANRVLIFARPSGADFTSGQSAEYVIGQTNFNTSSPGNGTSITELRAPLHLAIDSSDRLYVCDFADNRLAVFAKPTGSNPSALLTTAVGGPIGIAVSQTTGLIWITNGNNLFQLPEYSTLQTSGFQATQQLQPLQLADGLTPVALALALDPFDNPIVADGANRVTFFFNQLFYRNTANYSTGMDSTTSTFVAGPTPTMLAELHQWNAPFNFTSTYSGSPANLSPPFPLTVNNNTLQVTVNGLPAPIFRVDTPSVNDGDVLIEIPNQAPTSGPADFVISNPTTGQIYATATLNMVAASPGIYAANAARNRTGGSLELGFQGELPRHQHSGSGLARRHYRFVVDGGGLHSRLTRRRYGARRSHLYTRQSHRLNQWHASADIRLGHVAAIPGSLAD